MDTLRKQESPHEIAISVGTGHTYSLLRYLRPKYMLIIDRDITTLRLHATLGRAILDSTSYDKLTMRFYKRSDDTLDKDARSRLSMGLRDEGKCAGKYHWRYDLPTTQESINSHPPVFVCADINNPDLGEGLQQLSKNTGLTITYANFTNVAQWQAITDRPLEFAKEWPLKDDALILSSDRITPDQQRALQPLRGFDSYVDYVKDSTNHPWIKELAERPDRNKLF